MTTAKQSGIPEFLRNLDRWTTWRLEETAGGRLTKRPAGSTLDPNNQLPFDAVADVELSPEGGVGFIFTGRVRVYQGWLLALDVDACREPRTGLVMEWAREIIGHYRNPYTEVTPSGTGLRVYLIVEEEPGPVPTIIMPGVAAPGVTKKPEIQVFGCGPAG